MMNHFVFRVFCIVLVVVINSEIGASLNYKDDCSSAPCVDTALVCNADTNKCACADTHFPNNADDACVQKVAIDAVCSSTVTATNQCAVTNTECVDDGTSSSTHKCLCTATYYSDGTACQAKIALNTACTTSPTGQCADSLAECDGTALLCKCKTGNFEKNDGTCAAQVAALDGACVTAETATDQCAIADSECRTDQCLCKATHYTNGAACTARIAPGDTCAANQCVEHATCDTTTTNNCECDAGYTASPATSPTMCSGVVKFASLSYMYVVPILVSMMSLLR